MVMGLEKTTQSCLVGSKQVCAWASAWGTSAHFHGACCCRLLLLSDMPLDMLPPSRVLHASGTLLPSCSVSPIRNSLSAKALGVTTPPPHTSLPWRQGTWLMLSLGGDSNMHGWVRGTLHLHLALTSAQSWDTSEERNAS